MPPGRGHATRAGNLKRVSAFRTVLIIVIFSGHSGSTAVIAECCGCSQCVSTAPHVIEADVYFMELLYALMLCAHVKVCILHVCQLIFHHTTACLCSSFLHIFSTPSINPSSCLITCLPLPLSLYLGAVSGCRCAARVQAPGSSHPQVDGVALQPLQGGVGLAHPAAGHLHRHPDTLLSGIPP